MALEDVLNDNGSLGHGAGSPVSGGTFVIQSSPSTKMRAVGIGVHKTPLSFTFSGGSAAGCNAGTVNTPSPLNLNADGVKVDAEGVRVMRENDIQTYPTGFMCTPTGGGAPIPVPNAVVEVASAGQVKVRAE